MSNPTLGASYDDIAREIGWFMGFGTDPSGWGDPNSPSSEYADIDTIIQRGYRQFLNPPALAGETKSHSWSFLLGLGTMVTWKDKTGTVSGGGKTYIAPRTTINATASVFYQSMEGATITFSGGDSGDIHGFVDDDTITVGGDNGDAGETFTVSSSPDGVYTLPDDFGGLYGDMTFTATTTFNPSVREIAEPQLRVMEQSATTNARPQYCAVYPEPAVDSSYSVADETRRYPDQTRWRVRVWPTPDQEYTLTYRYHKLQRRLSSNTSIGSISLSTVTATDFSVESSGVSANRTTYTSDAQDLTVFTAGTKVTISGFTSSGNNGTFMVISTADPGGGANDTITVANPNGVAEIQGDSVTISEEVPIVNPYPEGGAAMSECIISSCLAVAEEKLAIRDANKRQQFMQILQAAVTHDRTLMTPKSLGYNGDSSDGVKFYNRDLQNVTFGGVQYP